ncbi:flagellar hook capping FlgD N-terminal domain-containing protein [Actibacterium ureilyticum]|uniref:flagellar hook capping FlgD N-terminal domain-containing protein n=1 Tax=Actibacterium ureilyticum TaxID=1590614 RepID=UPI000BAB1E81|nr:flagellar hook capping FlgD N-terminal domain-containing protein [Actibacterium ureilyticum]
MNVTETTQTTTVQQQSTQSSSASNALSSDFETFLKMLTTQLENQDPLNPMESSEFAVQLATFSGVEQQVRMNDQLAAISAQLDLGGLGQTAAWVGMEARAAAPAWFEGQPITMIPDIASGADKAQLVVSDAQGQVVQRLTVDTDGSPFEWSGRYEDGMPLPDGTYTFRIESYAGDDLLDTTQAEHFATVTEIRMTDAGPAAVLTGGVEVATDQIVALRDPALAQ